jgi:hypothetical protein
MHKKRNSLHFVCAGILALVLLAGGSATGQSNTSDDKETARSVIEHDLNGPQKANPDDTAKTVTEEEAEKLREKQE